MEEELIRATNLQYSYQLLEHAGSLPLDVARDLLVSHASAASKARCTGRRRLTGGYIQCPKCGTPRIANLVQSRLLGCPRNQRDLREILKQERKRPGKLTVREKRLLHTFRSKENTIEVTCMLCRYKMVESFPMPVIEQVEPPQVIVKKKKKKRSAKEANAGLLLNPSSTTETSKISLSSNSSQHFDANLSRKESKKNRKALEIVAKKNINDPVTDLSHVDKSLSERLQRSLSNPVILNQSNSLKARKNNNKSLKLSTAGLNIPSLESQSNVSSAKKKEKYRKLACLKNAMVKDLMKESNSSKQNNSLGDFLGSLF